jgi:hypothetical protein
MTVYQTYHHNRNYGCRITEFIYEGYRCVALENEKLRVTVVADKGTDIIEFLYKPKDIDFMWRTREGLRPAYLPQHIRQSGTFMDNYAGGWQEMFPNCGSPSQYRGAEIGQHGEVASLPWRYTIIKDQPDEIIVRFEVRTVRTPFHLAKTLSLKRHEGVLRIHEKVTNEGGQLMEFIWGHHPALGHPFVDESCRVDVPPCRIRTTAEYTGETSRLVADQNSQWPLGEGRDDWSIDLSKIHGPEVEASEMVFLEDFTDGWFAVTNTDKRVGFAMRYPAEIFKVLWYWQIYRGGRNYPWWSATYNIALEPCVALPRLDQAVKNGQALTLAAGASLEVELLAIAYEGLGVVDRVEADGSILGG